MIKKIIALALAALLVSSVIGCGETTESTKEETKKTDVVEETPAEDENEQETAVEDEPVVDAADSFVVEKYDSDLIDNQALVGAWNCVDGSLNGEYMPGIDMFMNTFNSYNVSFSYDSRSWGSLLNELYGIESGSLEVKVTENKIEFIGAEAENLEIQIEYELGTTYESKYYAESEDITKYFSNPDNKDNKLTIHITGTFTESQTSVKTIDTVLEYEKSIYPGGVYATNMLDGTWTDNYGNMWNFYYGTTNFGDEWTMKTKNGDVYTGYFEFMTWSDAENGFVFGLDIDYKDTYNDDFQAYVNFISPNKVETTMRKGGDFILTR